MPFRQPQELFLKINACLSFKYCVQYISICLKPYIKPVALKVNGMFRQKEVQFTTPLTVCHMLVHTVYRKNTKQSQASDVLKGYEMYFKVQNNNNQLKQNTCARRVRSKSKLSLQCKSTDL